MRVLPTASLGLATLLAVAAGCGGGGEKRTTTTSAPPVEETTTSVELTTTTAVVDPALQALLLVAADLPGFKDPTSPSPSESLSTSCDPAEVPGVKAIIEAPTLNGATLVKGASDAVKVSSRILSIEPDQAQTGLTQLLDQKASTCLENDLRAVVEKEQPGGTTVTLKLASSQLTAAGAEQAVVLAGTATVKGDTVSRTLRYDLGFLRSGGKVLIVSYSGPSTLTSSGERQGILVTAANKLSGAATGAPAGAGTSTTAGSGGSSTSVTRRTSTTRRAATTTSTQRATTTSSSSPQKITTTTKAGGTP